MFLFYHALDLGWVYRWTVKKVSQATPILPQSMVVYIHTSEIRHIPMTRKLARIAQVSSTKPIEGADRIECAVVENGWEVVVKKGEFAAGDVAIYIEVDSWVPHTLAPFLTPKNHEPREYNGVKGERLRTVRLRGQISQGLLLKLSDIPMHVYCVTDSDTGNHYPMEAIVWELGEDLTLELGIQKYEPPIPAQLSGQVEGAFPSFIPKTDQERCQNLYKEIFTDHYNEVYEVTTKLDGTSCTIYINEGKVGVCSRNWEVKEDESNTLWRCARDQGIVAALEALYAAQGRNIAIQGEVIGEGIQGNQEGIKGQRFYVFDMYDITNNSYLSAFSRASMLYQMSRVYPALDLQSVPMLEIGKVLVDRNINCVADLLAYAEGPSLNPSARREGVVFKSTTFDRKTQQPFTFKAISPTWLLAGGEDS